MSFSERPHPPPCACPECQEWARVVVATRVETRKAPPIPTVMSPSMPMADFARGIIATACKATGMSEERLRELAAQIGEEIPAALPVERVSRAAVLSRGVPEIHVRAVYDHEPAECDALRAVRSFLDSDRTILVLSGGVGLRKTGSACWALTQKAGRFVTADDAIRLASSKLADEMDLWRRVRNAQLLVIDDVGGEYADDKGYGTKVLSALDDHRYSNALKTIKTTNLTVKQYAVDYGDRAADRIREVGRWVTLGGESVRRPPPPRRA